MENEQMSAPAPTPAPTSSMPNMDASAHDIAENKLFAIIAYLSILCLVPLLLKKDSPFSQFHGKQGLVLFILSIAFHIVGWFPFLGWAIWFFGSVFVFVVSLMGMYHASQGKRWELPFFGQYAQSMKL